MGKLFAFIAGAVVGAVGSWVYLNKKYFGPLDEPVEEEDDLPKVTREPRQKNHDDEATFNKEDKTDYQKMAKQYSKDEEPKPPYIIPRDEFGDGTMPIQVTLSYFEDGILTNEYNEILDDAEVKEALGEDFVNHFEDDLVYIRNEQRKCDYEVLREGITFHEPPEEE